MGLIEWVERQDTPNIGEVVVDWQRPPPQPRRLRDYLLSFIGLTPGPPRPRLPDFLVMMRIHEIPANALSFRARRITTRGWIVDMVTDMTLDGVPRLDHTHILIGDDDDRCGLR